MFSSLQAAILAAQFDQALGTVSITLVDNGNNEAILEKVISEAACTFPVSVIKNPKNVGYSAHNQAIQPSNADYHLILNPDVLLSASSLRAGLTYLQNNQDTVMICPYSEGQRGEPSYLCKRYPAVFDLALRGFANESVKRRFDARLMQYEYRDRPASEAIKAVELVSGCCILARTEALQQCHGFDARFFLYFEDFDLSLRMSKLGNLDYYPEMKIIHYGGNTASKGIQHILYFVRSAVRFYRKHGLRIV
ncbi:MAG: glycosyltransferase [Candidatus Azotimanducaceae bacterium WSBS_2022_MAG_OTU7]